MKKGASIPYGACGKKKKKRAPGAGQVTLACKVGNGQTWDEEFDSSGLRCSGGQCVDRRIRFRTPFGHIKIVLRPSEAKGDHGCHLLSDSRHFHRITSLVLLFDRTTFSRISRRSRRLHALSSCLKYSEDGHRPLTISSLDQQWVITSDLRVPLM